MHTHSLPSAAFRLTTALFFCFLLIGQSAFGAIGTPSEPLESRDFSRERLVGSWKGSHEQEGGTLEETAVFSADGSFKFFFVFKNASGEIEWEQTSMGLWGVSGDIHFTIELKHVVDGKLMDIDTTHQGAYHAYKMIDLSDSVFVYRSLETDTLYRLRRHVGGLATLPQPSRR